jgi:hypothetical protein
MPFTFTPTRSQGDLTEFFETNLKARIESEASLKYRYRVRRSDDTFNITEQIIRDLYDADIVLCDLSGHSANPNVMYELGVRLSVTNRPVILFREADERNQRIFDIQGFYAFEYRATRYRELEAYIITKLRKYENGEEIYESPIQKVLRDLPSILHQAKRDQLVATLQLVETNLESARIGFDLAVSDYLEHHDVSLTTHSVASQLLADLPRFSSIDWSGLKLRPAAIPGVHAFLSQPLLYGVFPPADVKSIVEAVADYYSEYFADHSTWDTLTFDLLLEFLVETEAIEQAVMFLWMYFEQPDERAAFLQNAFDRFKSPMETVCKFYKVPEPS